MSSLDQNQITLKTYAFREACLDIPMSETELRRWLIGTDKITKRNLRALVQDVLGWAGVHKDAPPIVIDDSHIDGLAAFAPVARWFEDYTLILSQLDVPVYTGIHEACHIILHHKGHSYRHTPMFRTLELLAYEEFLPPGSVRWDQAPKEAKARQLAWTSPATVEAKLDLPNSRC